MTKPPMEMRPVSTCSPPTHSTTRNVRPMSASQQRVEDALNAHQPEVLRRCTAWFSSSKRAQFGAFLREGAHHAHAREVLLHPAAEMSENIAWMRFEARRGWRARRRSPPGSPAAPAESASSASRQSTETMMAIGKRERQPGFEPVHDARPQHHAHGVQVVGGARHDVAGARAAVVIRRESGARWRNRSLRRSYSMSREMPMRITRIQN